MELAEQRRKKALQAGDQTAADLETRTLAGHATDVPKGQASGQKLGMPQQASLSTLRAFDAADYAALKGHMKDVKAGKGTPALLTLWNVTQGAINDTRRAIADLTQFSKTGSPASNSKITNAIEHATVQLRVLSDIVGGS